MLVIYYGVTYYQRGLSNMKELFEMTNEQIQALIDSIDDGYEEGRVWYPC